MPTLFCPTCGYNLTGLLENRCPECGSAFDPVLLEAAIRAAAQPIQLGEFLLRLILPPGIFLLSSLFAFATQGQTVPFAILGGLFLIIYGIINARNLSKRLAARQINQDDPQSCGTRPWYFIALCTTGLYCCQLAIGFGGCVTVVVALM